MANFTGSKGWKLFMAKLYGLGAAVVIVGALFKLEHFPGASIMLIVGMSVEAFIFICSAFEPLPHPEPQWELVYPELAADGGGAHHGVKSSKGKSKKKSVIESAEVVTVATGPSIGEIAPTATGSSKDGIAALAAIGNIDLGNLNIEKLATGLNKLGETTEKLTTLSETAVAANTLSEKMHHASLTVANFSQSYENSSQTLSESIHALADTYQGTAEIMNVSGKQMGDSMSATGKQVAKVMDEAAGDFAKAISASGRQVGDEVNKTSRQVAEIMGTIVENFAKVMDDSSKQVSSEAGKIGKQMTDMIENATGNFAATFAIIDQQIKENLNDIGQNNILYTKQVEVLNKNLTALNTVYELQAQETGKYHKNSAIMGQHLESFVAELAHSVDGNRNFGREITHLNKSIAELNSIYGSMLSAVQLATKKK
ncbi:MAG: gliding motility protein GldL [Prevotellaceae bacterium]|jgi:gliding motility-associated protein GldL|nr:gliding motility protein GldL [Prevotellaceae bacterium]